MKEASGAGNPGRDPAIDIARAVARTRAWVEHAVIGLDLCPFARGPRMQERIRYRASGARDEDALLADLAEELHLLADADPQRVETTLLVHPLVLTDFDSYNQFLDAAEGAVEALGHAGILQVASFHPHYRFAGTASGDMANATNRSPYPTLHLLREASVERAVRSWGDVDSIYRANIRTMQALGDEGWARILTLIDAA
jgi:hypothetical protein